MNTRTCTNEPLWDAGYSLQADVSRFHKAEEEIVGLLNFLNNQTDDRA